MRKSSVGHFPITTKSNFAQMTITAPISMSKIVAEFGGPNNLKEYYRGGGYVPNIPENQNIATDPNQLKISQFLGARKAPVFVPLQLSRDSFELHSKGRDNAYWQFAWGRFTLSSTGAFQMSGGPFEFASTPAPQGQLVTAGNLSDYELADVWFTNDRNSIVEVERNGNWKSADSGFEWFIKGKAKAPRVQRFAIHFRRKGELDWPPQAQFNIYFHTSNYN